ncbi:hypothetical protein IMSHALPRED_002868 [Imshaugia aleurites]|uniref:Uncharacterized protein n=1 Tax=Imshaugia aleurites TaxID=172621 RepID=A0A8H3J6V8_9LECA|nr:hypothetical protein IMSHALPRED_002868 [Imshaugia aleurites]
MAINSDLGRILDPKYDPANDSPTKFCDSYKILVEHRNELRERLDDKEKRPSASTPSLAGNKFGILADNDSGSAIPPPTKHQYSASLTATQLDKLPIDMRMEEVAKIKSDIEALKEEKIEAHDAAVARSKEIRVAEEGEGNQQEQHREDWLELEHEQGFQKVEHRKKR